MRSSINNLTESASAKATVENRIGKLIEDTTQLKQRRLQSENSVDVTLYVELSILLLLYIMNILCFILLYADVFSAFLLRLMLLFVFIFFSAFANSVQFIIKTTVKAHRSLRA